VKKLKIIYIICSILLAASQYSSAGAAGTTSFEFLNIPVGARESGLGSASAVACGANAFWWNPAKLAYLERNTASLAYNSWFEGIGRQRAGYSFLLPNRSAGAANLQIHSVRGIDGYDWYGTPTSELKAASYALSYTQARRFTNLFAAGLNFKALYEVLENENAFAAAADAGVIFEPVSSLWLSLGVRNLGAAGSFIDENERLPFSAFCGVGLRVNRYLLLSSDIYYTDSQFKYGAGLEAGLWDLIFVRGGWNNWADLDDGFHLGAGWRYKDIMLDYSYSPYADMGIAHRVDISFEFGELPMIERLYRGAKSLYSNEKYRKALIEFNKVFALDPHYKQIRSWLEKTDEKIRDSQSGELPLYE